MNNDRHQFVPLTPAIARAFYGTTPARTARGYAYLRDGEPLVIWGLLRDPYRWVLFSDWKPEAREKTFSDRRLIVQALKHLRTMLAGVRGPVQVVPDDRIEGACALIERIGFVHAQQGIYQWQAPQPSSQPH